MAASVPLLGQAAAVLPCDGWRSSTGAEQNHKAGEARVLHAFLQRPSGILGSLQSLGKPLHPGRLQAAASRAEVGG